MPIANKALFDQGRKKLTEALLSHDITKPKGGLNTYGTAVLINVLNEAGGLPTRNFSTGRFEGAAKIAGEAIFEGNKERSGKETLQPRLQPGCIIQCSNTWHDADGSEAVSCQEYESVWALGANCGIDRPGRHRRADPPVQRLRRGHHRGRRHHRAWPWRAALAQFGDGEGAIKLMEEIGKGTPLGRILGNGAAFTARAYGVRRVPVVKGQAMPAYEPRAVKGIGVTYATTTMGADHTAGYTIAPEILGVSGKVDPFDSRQRRALAHFQSATGLHRQLRPLPVHRLPHPGHPQRFRGTGGGVRRGAGR